MVKTKIIETTEKYDDKGKLIEKIVREETTEDDTKYYPDFNCPDTTPNESWRLSPTCTPDSPVKPVITNTPVLPPISPMSTAPPNYGWYNGTTCSDTDF